MFNKKILIINIFTLSLLANANFEYKGQEITPENLYEFAPKAAEEIATNVRQSFENNPRLKALLENPKSWTQAHLRQRLLLNYLRHNANGKSNSNYVFVLEAHDGLFVKISGHVNRLVNLLRDELGEQKGFYGLLKGNLSEEEIDKIDTNKPTYQTASRIAYNLLIKQFLTNHPEVQNLSTPEIYLVTLDGTNNVSDTNAIILERKLKNLILLEDYLEENKLTEETINHLAQLITECGLWYIQENLFVHNNQILILSNTEQPNKACPSAAFFKPTNKNQFNDDYEWNTITGLIQLYKILQITAQEDILREFVRSNEYLHSFARYTHLAESLDL